jgi:hypothetical protein
LAVRDGHKFYQRIWTPLVVLWAMIFQRLSPDHTCAAAVQHVRWGGADHLAPRTPSLAERIRSVGTSAYCQARERLPLAWVQQVLVQSGATIAGWLAPAHTWHGHAVVLLDGTQVRLRPTPALAAVYAPQLNQHGATYWLQLRCLVATCLGTGALRSAATGDLTVSEQALTPDLCAPLPANVVWVADRNFGVYSVVQAVRHYGQHIVVRLERRRARALAPHHLGHGSDCPVTWACRRSLAHPTWPAEPLPGRLIHVYLRRSGFRTIDLYLFTTLRDTNAYPLAALVELYGQRWQVELRLRDVKSTLGLDALTAKTPDMVHKELYAGLIAYNLIRGLLTQAALQAGIPPLQLSFSQCRRCLYGFVVSRPWAAGPARFQSHLRRLLTDLARYRLPARDPWRIEPRAVRRRPAIYPNLKGSRATARAQARAAMQP